MQSIDKFAGIDEACAILEPHWEEIEEGIKQHQDRFQELWTANHDVIGRILKAHLVLESFINSYLEHHYYAKDIQNARLSFYQKATLLPRLDMRVCLIKPAILQVNAIRNKFGHQLHHKIEFNEIGEISKVLEAARHGVSYSNPLEAIEAFIPVACTFLTFAPPHIDELFKRAFSKV